MGRYSDDELEKQREERLGEENYNNFGSLMRIIKYNSYADIWIEFQDEYKEKIHTSYKEFKKGNVKNLYDKSICGVGYLGNGKYNAKDYKLIYTVWHNMIKRCYDPYELNKHLTYIDVYVYEKWHCFQNFAKWWETNYYKCNNEMMCLDKDILYKNNQIYSPKTCLIVPEKINKLFIKQQRKRGKYPIGVTEYYDKRRDRKCLRVRLNTYENKIKHLGYFPLNRPFQAFTVYKNFKENYIKQVADEYKDLIPKELYEALYKYEVEIND